MLSESWGLIGNKLSQAAQDHRHGEFLPVFRINHYEHMARLGVNTPRTCQLTGELNNRLQCTYRAWGDRGSSVTSST